MDKFNEGLHPVIRVVSVVIVASFVSFGGASVVGVTALLLVFFYIRLGQEVWSSGMAMLRRLRWLFLSIFILYFWFTPGVNSGADTWLPSAQGFFLGVERAAAIMVIVLTVNLLLRTTSREGLFQSIFWLVRPIRCVGISAERFAVRVTLVLETLEEAQAVLTAARQRLSDSTRGWASIPRSGKLAGEVLQQTVSRAQTQSLKTLTIHDMQAPAPIQWAVPVVLSLVSWLVAGL